VNIATIQLIIALFPYVVSGISDAVVLVKDLIDSLSKKQTLATQEQLNAALIIEASFGASMTNAISSLLTSTP